MLLLLVFLVSILQFYFLTTTFFSNEIVLPMKVCVVKHVNGNIAKFNCGKNILL